jgi:hypothetical protein
MRPCDEGVAELSLGIQSLEVWVVFGTKFVGVRTSSRAPKQSFLLFYVDLRGIVSFSLAC